jgi:hypothetical protein
VNDDPPHGRVRDSRHAGAFVGAGKEPSCCGFATAGAEIGRPEQICSGKHFVSKHRLVSFSSLVPFFLSIELHHSFNTLTFSFNAWWLLKFGSIQFSG